MRNVVSRIVYVFACLLPGPLVVWAVLAGGNAPLCALLGMTLWVWLMDRAGLPAAASARLAWLPQAVGVLHFAALAAVLWALRGGWQGTETLALMIAAGLAFGQSSNSCAHELIHRPGRLSRGLGMAIYCSLLNGQHVSAHLMVHHVHAGTAQDPNSARRGEGFYRFFLRASVEEFLAGLSAENRRRAARSRGLHPFALYLGGAAASLALATAIAGLAGGLGLIALALHAQAQLLLSDYVQHYGLRRQTRADGRLEPMGPHHCWNAPQSYSAAMMLSAPLHSDHHAHPHRPHHALRFDADAMPRLPYPMPVMAAAALVPPLWRHLMDARAEAWNRPSPFPAARAA
jgi:alkane 1-monooxygenase